MHHTEKLVFERSTRKHSHRPLAEIEVKKILYILLLLTGPFLAIGQQASSATLKGLKKVNCAAVNDTSSERKQLQCLGLDVIQDSINHFPEFARTSGTAVTTPDMAWKSIKELYPDTEFTCWTEYCGYYVFSFDCGIARNKNKCSFLCIIYIPIGGNEFWWYAQRI